MRSIDPVNSPERRLRLRAEQLRSEIATVRGRSGGSAAGEVGDAKDAADSRAQAAVADAEVERDLAELRDIDLALRRINDGSYGICNDCDKSIDPRRILAQPAALRCVECQAVAEGNAAGVAAGRVGGRQ
jgi:DnaK suppressor protein